LLIFFTVDFFDEVQKILHQISDTSSNLMKASSHSAGITEATNQAIRKQKAEN